jgi:dTDP-4-amino-4,6-dideoxygalactose transaminase
MIQLTNINRLHNDLRDSLVVAQEEVLNSGQIMLGKFTEKLEERIAELSNAKYCCVVGSGSDALMYGLMATNIKQIAIPDQTFIATKNSCVRARIPITYNDVDETGCIDWNKIKTEDVIWVGLFGNDTTFPDNINVYEDGAQHFGLPLKGVFASYSFDPTKTLPNFGNGGCIVTNDPDIYENIKQLRRHGTVYHYTGGNSTMSERDCAELLVKLDFFNTWTNRRQAIASLYKQNLSEYVKIITDENNMVSKFVISTKEKDNLKNYLLNNFIQSKDVYSKSISGKPQATKNCKEFLSIPCDSYTTDNEVLKVIDTIKMFFEPSPFKT